MSENKDISSTPSGTSQFATTRWSVVLAAVSPSSPKYQQALSTLCQTYWFPLYAYLRRHGCDTHQAEDCTQAFFAQMLEKHSLRLADPKGGKFRSYLLAALKHFLADERDRVQAQKRGGGQRIFSLDFENAEDLYGLEPADQLSPERLFEKSWALVVLQKVMARLGAESASVNKQKVFEHLITYLAPAGDVVPYRDMAAKLNMTEGAVKVAVHRLRKRYQELLRDEIGQTVATEEEIDQELRDLFEVLSC
jgi:RNA polymerase sigma-70 factor (ECF subfamily)